ncbi:pimeloyl-ACP methyl ester carboxylesterase [Actinoplanes octamycinicus]|uniref:Pimeloyl-ACP methyl ester carboxylesterase n=1 Tax=Actinoplanes octamycinicus TaxID=135948 RepID=A0A7W7H308_9ACTN|nr:epoxide hydrolase family protein [Actinoplanes octamycinicus]MBB4742988.1 pimeloyl-ACP methyl ester carboxylesterase [Actinoplanes octamycinicus]GIE58158.1 hydrolase [Actinoplanes octamycinicus]
MRINGIEPYRVEVPESDLVELRDRLARTRWPEAAWGQGIPLRTVRELCEHWVTGYDWRAAEARLNAYPQLLITVDDLPIHVLHARSPRPGALPLILTHGWPGSVLELVGLVGPLTEAGFDVVIPSLPGYGFSGKPAGPGWGIERIAAAWAQIMEELGHLRYGAAGSDWGTSISTLLATTDSAHVCGIHLVPPLAGPAADDDLTPAERDALARLVERSRTGSAYSEVHRTAPQTVGFALTDSPAGLCAWMAEKLLAWSDEPTRPTPDQILDQVTLYWLTGTATSSARLYAESIEQVSRWITRADAGPVHVPVGASIFPAELPRSSRRWAARRYPDIRYWKEHDRGGHFPALEAPDLLVADLHAFFGPLR